MFRYIAFAWDSTMPTQQGIAKHLDDSLRHAVGWRQVLYRPGLRVHVIGTQFGVNESYPLPPDRGVILGHLFRSADGSHKSRDVALSAQDVDQILESDGRALVKNYWGRYVAILTSSRLGTLVLRDPSGTLPCYRSSIEGVNVIYSWLEDFIAFKPAAPVAPIDWNAIAAILSLGHIGGRATALKGVEQILPGQLTSLAKDAAPPVSLWSAVAVARGAIDIGPESAAARLRHAVIDCVQAWSSCHDSVLLRLSGGVDSAILLGSLVATPSATRIACLNYHSPGADSDERGYARLAAMKAGVELVERERDATFQLEEVLTTSRMPTPEGYIGRMDASHIDAEVATAIGARAMLTGAGGDQLFFQLRCTWPAADYLKMHGPGRGFVLAALDAARLGRVSIWQSMRRALADQHHQTRPSKGIGRHFTLVNRDVIDDVALDRYIHPDLQDASDLPIGKFNQLQQLINPFGYYDPFLRDAAPELVNPLLSQPLIELCLLLPTWLLTYGGQGRALVRRAFAPELPREIAFRQSKGGMEEHVTAVLTRNLPLARELLLDGHLVRSGLLNRKSVETALDGRPSALDGFVSEIHHHIATEAWLQQATAQVGHPQREHVLVL